MNRANQLLSIIQADISCPTATQNISLNLANRQKCVDTANYGPANPNELNPTFWQDKANLFKSSVDEAQTMRCKNCAAFIQTDKMLQCIKKGISPKEEIETTEVDTIIELADLGYCELFDFKCAGARTCDAWLVNGPISGND